MALDWGYFRALRERIFADGLAVHAESRRRVPRRTSDDEHGRFPFGDRLSVTTAGWPPRPASTMHVPWAR